MDTQDKCTNSFFFPCQDKVLQHLTGGSDEASALPGEGPHAFTNNTILRHTGIVRKLESVEFKEGTPGDTPGLLPVSLVLVRSHTGTLGVLFPNL